MFAVMTLFFMQGCANSYLYYTEKDQKLTLSLNNIVQQFNGKTVAQQRKNFSSLFLTQKVLRMDDGSVLVYEDGYTDPNFQFEQITSYSIRVIFEARSLYRVYSKDNLYFYQVALSNGHIINLITQQSDNQKLTMLYGMSTKSMNTLISKFDQNAPKAKILDVVRIKEPNSAIKSRWDFQKVHFVPLVGPFSQMMGPP